MGGVTVAVALGSNLGDRRGAIAFATGQLSRVISGASLSSIIETEPEGEGLQAQPRYLNAVLVGETRLSARALLEYLLATEQACGRERSYQGAPRTLDLDLVLFGDALIEEPDLKVPHPRFRDRDFVLGPLAEVAPDLRDPVTGLTAGELLDRWKKAET